MCGIIGEISNSIDSKKFISMRDTLIHRGPDDEGLYINDSKEVALGHRRLAIIDLSEAGKQPMCNENGSIWISYNGEIYNFQEIKKELEKYGHQFRSKTDTEVIIHAYEEWGIECVKRFNGMFAFGIWDENEKTLFLARDRIGIKPLYYYYNDNKDRFIFASEIKAIVKDKEIERILNPKALINFFLHGFIPSPYSIWENISKLPPGYYLIYKNKKIIIKPYWEIESKETAAIEKDIYNNIIKILTNSIELYTISDVPVGVLLSGGLDSSTITCLANKLNKDIVSFSIGFEAKEYDELKYVQLLVDKLKIKNIKNILSSKNYNEFLERILYYYDEPLGVSSIFPTFLLMQTIRGKLKVVLSGDGGDEIFAGYYWYNVYESYRKLYRFKKIFKILFLILSKISKYFSNKYLESLKFYLKLFSSNDLERYNLINRVYFDEGEINNLFNKNFLKNHKIDDFMKKYVKKGLNNVKDIQILDIKTFLVDHILVKVDRASMANSIEVRVPFLDHNLVEYLMALDPKTIFKKLENKYLLKKAMKSILPDEIINRKKKGFSAPMDKLGFIKDHINILKDSEVVKDKILNKSYLDKILKTPINELQRSVWLIIYFELWYRYWKQI